MARLNARDAAARSDRDLAGLSPNDISEALARGLRVLTAFDEARPRMTLAEVARVVDLPRATVRRSLRTLLALGYVHLDGRVFELTPRVLTLATAYLTSNSISTVLQPACERLCEEVGLSTSVAVLDGAEAVMIARSVPNKLMVLEAGIGYRVPALHSALGRVLLSALDDEQLDQFLRDHVPHAVTPFSVTDVTVLQALLCDAREGGFAYVDREAEHGFHSVAVPLHRWDGRVVAAFNVGAHIDHVGQEAMKGRVLAALRGAAEGVSSGIL